MRLTGAHSFRFVICPRKLKLSLNDKHTTKEFEKEPTQHLPNKNQASTMVIEQAAMQMQQ
jgi:hypothetical protein